MKVTLNQEEIFTAIENYILETVRVGDNIRLDMDLAATRGAEGYTAMVTFVDITDESASTKDAVVPTEEAKGLSIVQKIEDARSKAPRRSPAKLPAFRQGTTAGVPEKAPTTEKGEDKAVTMSTDEVTEHTAPVKVDPPVMENPEVEYQPEPATEPESDQPTESQEEAPVEAEAVAEPEAEATPTTGEPKRSLFADAAPAQTEEALAAEAAATEPQEEDVDYTPTPETKGLESEDAGDPPVDLPVEAEKPKTRSLFGDLTKPAKN